MKEYICVVTSELGVLANDYVVSITFHPTESSAIRFGSEYVKDLSQYPALADFSVYKFLSSH